MDPCIVKSLRDNWVTIDFSYGMFDERDECVFEKRGNEHTREFFSDQKVHSCRQKVYTMLVQCRV